MRFLPGYRLLVLCAIILPLLTSCEKEPEGVRAEERLRDRVNRLASVDRLAGTIGEADAANYITDQFVRFGVLPFGDRDTFLQTFELQSAAVESMGVERHLSRNVAGVINGTVFPERYIIIGAHYDGPGVGSDQGSVNPDTIAPDAIDQGSVNPDADFPFYIPVEDHTSGVAGMLWLAEQFALEKPAVSTIFVAFSGEQMGLLGSSHFVNELQLPRDSILAMLNPGRIGRLQEGSLTITGAESSSGWKEIIETAATDSLEVNLSDEAGTVTDYVSFLSAGIPALHYSTDRDGDYQAETGAGEPINYPGMAAVLKHMKQVIDQLSQKDPEDFQFASLELIPLQDVMNTITPMDTVRVEQEAEVVPYAVESPF